MFYATENLESDNEKENYGNQAFKDSHNSIADNTNCRNTMREMISQELKATWEPKMRTVTLKIPYNDANGQILVTTNQWEEEDFKCKINDQEIIKYSLIPIVKWKAALNGEKYCISHVWMKWDPVAEKEQTITKKHMKEENGLPGKPNWTDDEEMWISSPVLKSCDDGDAMSDATD